MSYWYFVNEQRHVLEVTEEGLILLAELPTVDEAFISNYSGPSKWGGENNQRRESPRPIPLLITRKMSSS